MQTSTVYNALGQAVSMVDGAGYRSYKVYDLQGQVAYEVDSVGDVTAYGRDSFGQAVSLKRFATAINLPAGALALNLHDVETRLQANPAQDREIDTVFDKLGRAVEVREPSAFNFEANGNANVNGNAAAGQQYFASGKVTRNTYNVFGDLVRVSTLENALTDTWSSVNHYFDKHGQCIETIDALGYVTTYRYDTQGNTIAKFESAKTIVNWDGNAAPITPLQPPLETLSAPESPQDRFTSMEYDLNNRAIKQVFSDRQHLNEVDAQHVSTNEYDNVGNVTVKRAWGPGSHGAALATRNFYDALGRVVAVIDGSRSNKEQGVDINLLEVYTYDALGNMTQMTSYAKGAKNDLEAIPRELDSADRTTTYKYDAFGHALQVIDANHIEHNSEYDGRGLLTREWTKSTTGQAIANITKTYDAVGRLETDSATDQVNVYNAFGEITVQTLGSTVNHYEFDQAGRMWRTDQGGVVQVSLYDMHDKVVASLTSAGLANGNRDLKQAANAAELAQATDVRRTDYRYDTNGNNVAQILAERNGRRIVIHQSFDRWGNLLTKSDPTVAESQDAITRYTYDEMNRVTSERNPQADGTDGGRVREYIYTTGDFDTVIERKTIDRENATVTNASDNDDLHQRYRVITDTYNQSGKLLSSAVNGITTETHRYDLFAQVVADLIGGKVVVSYAYDKLGHVLSETHAPVDSYTVDTYGGTLSLGNAVHASLVNHFEYDELGHLKEMINTAGDVSQYAHDLQGNLTQSTDAMGHVTSYTWDKNGHKLSMTDALGGTMQWHYTSGGKLGSVTQYDGSATVYSYDNAGQLVQTLNAAKGNAVTNTYDAAGQLLQINDASTSYSGLINSGGSNLNSFGEERFIDGEPPQNSYSNISKITTYGYDSVGNRTREITEQNGQRYQDNELSYDALHRLTYVLAHDAVEGDQVVRYEYDNFGNRTRFVAQSAGTEDGRNENGYFFFDAVNRVIRGGALDAAGTVGGSTFRYLYDDAGNLRSRVMGGTRTETYEYDDMNRRISTTINHTNFEIHYDAAGRVVDEWVQVKDVPVAHAGADIPLDLHLVEPTAPAIPPTGSTQAVIDQYNLDHNKYLADKVVYDNKRQSYLDDVQNYDEQVEYANRVNIEAKADLGYEHHLRSYNQNGQVVREQGFQDNGSVKFHQFNSVIDALGNTLHYVTDSFVGDSATSTYDNVYMNGLFGRQLATSTGYLHMNQGQLAGRTGGASTSIMIYDANANLSEVRFQTSDKTTAGNPGHKQMYYDAEGHILQSVETDVKAKTIFQREIIVNGDLQLRYTSTLGGFAGDAKQEAGYEEGIANQASQTPLSYVALQADGTPQNSGRVLVAYDGENLRSIALRVYGNADKWYQLADANRLDPNQTLNGGQSLIVPAIIGGTDSRLDYNNSKLIGSTAPDLPPPEPNQKKGCATLLVIVIAVVASCVLGPEMLLMVQSVMGPGLAATMVAGALTGAAVSVVSQGAGMALGVQEHFSWKAVGQGFIGGGIAAGFSTVAGIAPVSSTAGSFSLPNLGISVVNGAMRSAVSQIVQGHFSWRQVAASAAMAGAGNAVSQSFAMANYEPKAPEVPNTESTNNQAVGNQSSDNQSSRFLSTLGERITGSVVSGVVSQAIMNKGKIDLRSIGISTFASVGAEYIGDYANDLGGDGSIGHSLAHAALGAATARMRHQDVWAGAIGAGVAAYARPYIQDAMTAINGGSLDLEATRVPTKKNDEQVLMQLAGSTSAADGVARSVGGIGELALYSTNHMPELLTNLTTLVSGSVSKAFGHDFDVAVGAATNEIQNNYLKHTERMALLKAIKSGNQTEVDKLISLSKERDGRLLKGDKAELEAALAAEQDLRKNDAEFYKWIKENKSVAFSAENFPIILQHATSQDLSWKIGWAETGLDQKTTNTKFMLMKLGLMASKGESSDTELTRRFTENVAYYSLFSGSGKVAAVGSFFGDALEAGGSFAKRMARDYTPIYSPAGSNLPWDEEGIQTRRTQLAEDTAAVERLVGGLKNTWQGIQKYFDEVKDAASGKGEASLYDVYRNAKTEGKAVLDIGSLFVGLGQIAIAAKAGKFNFIVDAIKSAPKKTWEKLENVLGRTAAKEAAAAAAAAEVAEKAAATAAQSIEKVTPKATKPVKATPKEKPLELISEEQMGPPSPFEPVPDYGVGGATQSITINGTPYMPSYLKKPDLFNPLGNISSEADMFSLYSQKTVKPYTSSVTKAADGTILAEEGSGASGANSAAVNKVAVIPENPSAYSVAFETKLNPADFGRSRDVHFNRANAALDNALKADAQFAGLMDDLIPNVQSSVSSVGGRATPTGWTWEHASTSTASGAQGVMRLVPTAQHTPGSAWWRVLHPDRGAAGGYSEWAIPNGAPKN